MGRPDRIASALASIKKEKMTKKSISKYRKEILKEIETKLNEGIPRQQILDELSEVYFDKSTIAKLIASTTDDKTKANNKSLNNILLGFLTVTIISKIILGISLLSNASIYLLPIVILFPLINIWFAVEVSKYKGYIYKILALLTIAGMIKMIGNYEGETALMFIDFGIGFAITGLSFYLGNKMFPNYGLFGPKKDEKGNLLLE